MKKNQYLIVGILFLMTAVINLLSATFSEGSPSKLIVVSSALFTLAAVMYFYNFYKSKRSETDE
ncbi:MAG: hypothetical protein AAF806_30690 [Bacteroidota bacterium]